ncbi:MAG: hypothetical protein ACRD0A_07850, partial [Acidimicrobiales bacterium]
MAEQRRSGSSRTGTLGRRTGAAARAAAVLATLLALVGLLPLVAAAQTEPEGGGASAPTPTANVEASVEAAMAANGTADFWVLFDARADLSAAYGISDWAARGQYVYDQLTATAAASQAAIAAGLTARNVSYDSFFIVNAIRLTGADQSVLDLARSGAGVAEIVAPRAYAVPDPIVEA